MQRSSTALEADARIGAVGAPDLGARRLARLLAPPLPAPPLQLRAGALPAPRLSRRRLGRRSDPRSGRLRAAAPRRVGLGRVLPRAPDRARADRRAGRELLPLQRGRRHLRADLAGRATRCGTCPRPSPSTREAPRRPGTRLLPILAASRIRYANKHDQPPLSRSLGRAERRAWRRDARVVSQGALARTTRPPARARRGADAASGRP